MKNILKLNLSKQSNRFLNSLSQKQFSQIDKKINQLKKDPLPNDNILLKGRKNSKFHRVTVGEYRIIYNFDEINLFIIIIEKRNDNEAYKNFFKKY